MASKIDFPLSVALIFALLLTTFSSGLQTSGGRESDDFQKWVSWHVQNHRKKAAEEADDDQSMVMNSQQGRRRSMIDMKLCIAEMNKTKIIVSQDGTGDFKTIAEAIDSIPFHNTRRVILEIRPGIYREKILIPKTKPYVTFLGSVIGDAPTITGNGTASGNGRTYDSATVGISSDYFLASNIKFENTAPHVEGSGGGQAVAVRISGTKAAFYHCAFYGYQDTLYDHKGLHYFNNCLIQGSVDFIFGYAKSLYENCVLISVARKVASVTAQKRSLPKDENSGFSFKDCKLLRGEGSGRVYLGRAWGPYSRVVFSYTFMDLLVLPQGWNDWGHKDRQSKVYYGEYKCSGPGADLSGRVPWARKLTDEEALPFVGTYFINADTWLINPQPNN